MAERAAPVPSAPYIENLLYRGQPCLHLRLPCGDAAMLALHGAQLLSWVAGGRERLYLSPKALFDAASAIRGGVPLCFPQFNQRGTLPKHGFARNLVWTVLPGAGGLAETAEIRLRLRDSDATRALWPHAFEATLTVELRPGSLQLTLAVRNTDARPLQFTGALHTYLAVDDIADTRLEGLQGQPGWDALTGQDGRASGELRFNGEFDRVYGAAPAPLTMHDGQHRLQIAQSASFTDTVVWNPGAALCDRLADMPADGFGRMLCVEAARVMAPVQVVAGDTWQGWQCLSVL